MYKLPLVGDSLGCVTSGAGGGNSDAMVAESIAYANHRVSQKKMDKEAQEAKCAQERIKEQRKNKMIMSSTEKCMTIKKTGLCTCL